MPSLSCPRVHRAGVAKEVTPFCHPVALRYVNVATAQYCAALACACSAARYKRGLCSVVYNHSAQGRKQQCFAKLLLGALLVCCNAKPTQHAYATPPVYAAPQKLLESHKCPRTPLESPTSMHVLTTAAGMALLVRARTCLYRRFAYIGGA